MLCVIMNSLTDAQRLRHLDAQQKGVYSKSDLRTAFGAMHPEVFVRRVRALIRHGILRRFCRGWYVAEEFDLATLSQRIAPESCISFGTVLAQNLIVGTNPARQIVAIKTGRPRRYVFDGFSIEHVSVAKELLFGFSDTDGVQYANTEKAIIDVLYFHLRGRRFPFDIYSDIDVGKLNPERLRDYLSRYQNPKFVTFAERVLDLQ